MNVRAISITVIQLLLSGCIIVMGVWAKISWPGTAGLVLATLGPPLINAAQMRLQRRRSELGLATAWAGTLLAWGTLLLTNGAWDSYYAVLAWLAAMVNLLAGSGGPAGAGKVRWRCLAMVWAMGGGWIWLVDAYLTNRRGGFLAGLLINLCLLILCRVWFSLGTVGIQTVNTLVLVLIGLPAADLLVRHPAAGAADPRQRYFSFEKGGKDPVSFAAWMTALNAQFDRMDKDNIRMRDASGVLPFRLRPNTHTMYFEIPVNINSRGFRGPEIPDQKGRTYRIVTLGESTTFGYGFTPEDRIWPAALQQLIRERLKPGRPVEVINAGVPMCDLKNNLTRLAGEILPLQPDMIISYHGLNGFHLISEALPRTSAKNPPRLKPRPVRLLAEAEYGWKVWRFKHRRSAVLGRHPPALKDPPHTEYAAAYRQLISFALTNKIRLVLANYSMAVNAGSDSRVVDFFTAAPGPRPIGRSRPTKSTRSLSSNWPRNIRKFASWIRILTWTGNTTSS